jgi:hypothetical protein
MRLTNYTLKTTATNKIITLRLLYADYLAGVFAVVCCCGVMPCYFTLTVEQFFGISKEAISVTGRGCLQACKMLTIPHYRYRLLIDGGKDVSLTHWPRSTLIKRVYSRLWYQLLLEAEQTPGNRAAGRIRYIDKNHSSYQIWNPLPSGL